MIKQFNANKARLKRHYRLRNRLEGTTARPRLNVFRSGKHIYAQIIDDSTGETLVAASSLDGALRDFKPSKKEAAVAQAKEAQRVEEVTEPEMAASTAPAKGKGAKVEKAPARGAQPQKGQQGKGARPGSQSKTVLPTAQKGEKKTPVEALSPIADNHKVALAREVGKLVGQRAKEKGVSRVVFDRGGYAYHGRVAALAEGAREVGLEF
jgi:ribosomal protein L18